MRFVLAGQPNYGKSTIFNSVAGYRAATANFPGSSISFTFSRALILGHEVEVVDLPGIYSLTSSKEDAGKAEGYLLEGSYDLIINVVDASRLGRSLELTMQLLELERPMIVALNMMDEAKRGGMEKNWMILRPESFALYIAASALEMMFSGVELPDGNNSTPILTVIFSTCPLIS